MRRKLNPIPLRIGSCVNRMFAKAAVARPDITVDLTQQLYKVAAKDIVDRAELAFGRLAGLKFASAPLPTIFEFKRPPIHIEIRSQVIVEMAVYRNRLPCLAVRRKRDLDAFPVAFPAAANRVLNGLISDQMLQILSDILKGQRGWNGNCSASNLSHVRGPNLDRLRFYVVTGTQILLSRTLQSFGVASSSPILIWSEPDRKVRHRQSG